MIRRILRGRCIRLSALALAVMFSFASGAFAQQGVTKDEILVGAFGPVTGPLGWLGSAARSGMEMAVSEINDHGGINGRKIKLLFAASGSSPAEFLAAAKKLVDQDKVFVLMIASGSTGAAAAADFIREKGIPSYNIIAATPKIHSPLTKNIFHGVSPAAKFFAQANLYRLLSFKPKPKRVAVLVEALEYHKSVFAGLKPLIKSSSAKLVSVQEFDPNDRDFTAQLLSIKKANPDVVMVQGDAAPAGFIIKQAADLGMGNVHWTVATSAANDQFIAIAGKAAEGVKTNWLYRYYTGSPKGDMPKFMATWEKRNPNPPPGRPNEEDYSGYNGIYITALALKGCGNHLTWDNLIKSYESLKDAVPSNLGSWASDLVAPITFTPTDHQGNDRMHELIVKDGKWQVNPSGDFIIPNSGQG